MKRKPDEVATTLLRCSFCDKSQKEVTKLIAGPTVYICDECIGLCNDIIADEVPLLGVAHRLRTAAKQMREIEDAGRVTDIHELADRIAALGEEIRDLSSASANG